MAPTKSRKKIVSDYLEKLQTDPERLATKKSKDAARARAYRARQKQAATPAELVKARNEANERKKRSRLAAKKRETRAESAKRRELSSRRQRQCKSRKSSQKKRRDKERRTEKRTSARLIIRLPPRRTGQKV